MAAFPYLRQRALIAVADDSYMASSGQSPAQVLYQKQPFVTGSYGSNAEAAYVSACDAQLQRQRHPMKRFVLWHE